MSAEIDAGGAAGRFDTLHAEAKAALAYAANTLRAVTEQYREAFHENLAGWHEDRDALDHADRRVFADLEAGAPGSDGEDAEHAALTDAVASVEAAEAGAEEGRAAELRRRIALGTSELGERQAELARLELAVRGLERTWLFLERGDASLLADMAAPDLADDLQMRIVEAREAERTRLAQEIHDGPAQALANAIFGV